MLCSAPSCRGAFRDCGRDGLLVFFVGVVLFRVAAAMYFLAGRLCPLNEWRYLQVALQYLVSHRTHRGASWASGAAQAAQFVRIILVWRRGVCELVAVNGGSFFVASVLLPLAGNFVAFAPASTRAIIRRNQASQASARLRIRARHQLAQIVGIITHRCCP